MKSKSLIHFMYVNILNISIKIVLFVELNSIRAHDQKLNYWNLSTFRQVLSVIHESHIPWFTCRYLINILFHSQSNNHQIQLLMWFNTSHSIWCLIWIWKQAQSSEDCLKLNLQWMQACLKEALVYLITCRVTEIN